MFRLDHTLSYPGATAEQVYAMLADPEFRTQELSRQMTLSQDVTITPSGAGMEVRIEQAKDTSQLPGFARKFVGDSTELIQQESWSSPTQATMELAIPGKPGEVHGTIGLSADSQGATEKVLLEITVNIPFIGSKVEGMLADLFKAGLLIEEQVGREWLA